MPWKRRVSKAEPLNQAENECLRGASPSLTPTLDLEQETDSKLHVSWAWISRYDLGGLLESQLLSHMGDRPPGVFPWKSICNGNNELACAKRRAGPVNLSLKLQLFK